MATCLITFRLCIPRARAVMWPDGLTTIEWQKRVAPTPRKLDPSGWSQSEAFKCEPMPQGNANRIILQTTYTVRDLNIHPIIWSELVPVRLEEQSSEQFPMRADFVRLFWEHILPQNCIIGSAMGLEEYLGFLKERYGPSQLPFGIVLTQNYWQPAAHLTNF